MFNKFKKSKKAPVPRPMSEIQKEYGQLCQQLGQLKYQEQVFKSDADRVQGLILQINREGAERQRLDNIKAQEEAAKPQPGKEEGN